MNPSLALPAKLPRAVLARGLSAVLLAPLVSIAAEHRDLHYTTPPDSARRLDIYTPDDGDNCPIAVWIHGGGWRRGDKSAVDVKPRAFTQRGYVFASINYRFVPQVTVEDQAADVAAAIRWLADRAGQYKGSPDKIIVMGHSAGAHLAALVATDGSYLQAQGLSLNSLKACIAVDTAAYDVSRQVSAVRPRGSLLYDSVFGRDQLRHKRLSPLTHVAAASGIPPFLILHVADRPDSGAQSRSFAAALRQAGVKAVVLAAEGKTHATINRELGVAGDKPTAAMFDFLAETLQNTAGPKQQ